MVYKTIIKSLPEMVGFFCFYALNKFMALTTFKTWRESSAFTRWRNGWGRYGNYPPSAGAMSHSTPTPFIMKKVVKELGSPKKEEK